MQLDLDGRTFVVGGGGRGLGRALATEIVDQGGRGALELVSGGPMRLLRGLVTLMGEGGSIVWIASTSAGQPIPGLDLSNAFRPGVGALVKVLARELAPRIRVNGIAPGMIDTD